MRIFVSSRIKELSWERKIAVETIHDSGHTPLYIETEPRDRKQAKERMDALIGRADGFLLLLYLSTGRPDPKLEIDLIRPPTPIEYEYKKFCEKHLDKQNRLILRKKTDDTVNVSNQLRDWFDNLKGENLPTDEFDTPEQLISLIKDWLMDKQKDKEEFDKLGFIIQYTGPDYIGLIAKISEVLFSKYTLNIDYISHASRSNRSTIYISCSSLKETNIEEKYLFSWDDIPGNDNGRLIEFLKKRFGIDLIDAKIEKIEEGRTIRSSFKNNFPSLKLNDDKTKVSLEIDDMRTDEFIARTENGKLNIYEEKFIKHLERILDEEIDKDIKLAIEDGRASEEVKLDGEEKKLNVKSVQASEKPFQIGVHQDPGKSPDYQYYVELRTINAPGQLNAVCNVLRDANYNIDEIVLKPTEKEHRRQTTISLWLSKKSYSFSWAGVLEKDGKKLIRYLKNEFDIDEDIEPVINKKGARTITVSFDKKFFDVTLKNKTLEIKTDGKSTHKSIEVKKENGKRMIYTCMADPEDELMILESRIRRLVGVRSFYTRIINYREKKLTDICLHTKVKHLHP